MKDAAFVRTYEADGRNSDGASGAGRVGGATSPQSPSSPGRAPVDAEELLQHLNSETPSSGEVKMLLSRNLVMGTRALQELSAEKEELARELAQRSDQLHVAEDSLKASEARALELEGKLQALLADVRAAATRADP